MRLCLDAGHGGKDAGAVSGQRFEKNDNLKMVLAVGKILAENDVDIVYTRVDDIYDSPANKAAIGNEEGVDFFVSFHRNSSDNASAKGTEVLVYNNSGKKAAIAADLCERYEALGFTDRGVKERPGLVVLKATTMPAILIELGFISNAADNTLLDKEFDNLARATASGIIAFWDKSLKSEEESGKWVKNGDYWEYWQNGIQVKNDWILDQGYWYWFNEKGQMHIGWISYKNRWYYCDPSGKMQVGMTNVSEKWYYFNPGQLGNGTDYGALTQTSDEGILHIFTVQ